MLVPQVVLLAGCSSCHPASGVIALKETQSTSGLSSSTTRLPTAWVLLRLCQLSASSTRHLHVNVVSQQLVQLFKYPQNTVFSADHGSVFYYSVLDIISSDFCGYVKLSFRSVVVYPHVIYVSPRPGWAEFELL